MPWLMKAEPDSRVIKGKDVKARFVGAKSRPRTDPPAQFSVDDFEQMGSSPWDGVRSHEAKKIMKEKMKVGDEVLFYHSNCKVPGVYALAEVAREGYPDHTAWDSSHPYFDTKTDEANPTWYMVDVKFRQRLMYPPTLALIKYLAPLASLPPALSYVSLQGHAAIKSMALINRGRLSVQPVDQIAYDAIVLLGTRGGWEGLIPREGKKRPAKRQVGDEEAEAQLKGEEVGETAQGEQGAGKSKSSARKRKTMSPKKEVAMATEGVRKSSRTKR